MHMSEWIISNTKQLEVARKAWGELSDGAHEDFEGHRVVKTRKYVLVMPKLDQWPQDGKAGNERLIRVAVYPKPEHIDQFLAAKANLRAGGPSDSRPGAVGSIALLVRSNGELSLSNAQAHFKIGAEPGFIHRDLADYYGGWRFYALKKAVQIAKLRGSDMEIETSHVYRRPSTLGGSRSAFHEDLLKIARETGTKLKAGVQFYRLKTKD